MNSKMKKKQRRRQISETQSKSCITFIKKLKKEKEKETNQTNRDELYNNNKKWPRIEAHERI